jgi:hypothetical protein
MIATVCKTRPPAGVGGASKPPQYGSDVGGLLRYLYGPGKANEHTNPHLVGSWDGDLRGHEPTKFTLPNGSQRVSVSRLSADLTETMKRANISLDSPYVYHVSVSLRGSDDGQLSDEKWAEIAEDLMDRTGISPAGDDDGCRWVAVRHGLSSNGNDHIHIVATLAREDGKKPRIFNDFRALRDGAQHWEKELGLSLTADIDGTAIPTAQRGEQAKDERQGRGTPTRTQLTRIVRQAAAGTDNTTGFFDRLEDYNVHYRLRHSTTDPDQITGYAVGLPGHTSASGEQIYYSGKTLGGQSLPKLRASWTHSDQHTGPAPRARGARIPARTRLTDIVSHAATNSDNTAEFVERLEQYNVRVRVRHSTINDADTTGYAVGLPGHTSASGEQIYYSGKTLGGQSLPNLNAMWERRAGAGPRQQAIDPDGTYRQFEQAATRVVTDLKNPDTLNIHGADLAWAASDAASAWAATEPVTADTAPNAIAEHLARAARPTNTSVPLPTPNSRGLRTAARMLYLSRSTMDSDTNQQTAQMTAVMLELAAAIMDYRREQGMNTHMGHAGYASYYAGEALEDLDPITADPTPPAATPPPTQQPAPSSQPYRYDYPTVDDDPTHQGRTR